MQTRDNFNKLLKLVPTGITLLRVAAAPLFYAAFLRGDCLLAFGLFAFAAFTDLADGFAARKLHAASAFGAYADVLADFVLIVAAFAAFLCKGWYCLYVFIPIGVSFVSFLISSGAQTPRYDPLGKYTGCVLMAVIALSLLLPFLPARQIMTFVLFAFLILCQLARWKFLQGAAAENA